MSREDRVKSKMIARRSVSGMQLKESFLIFCEGETEKGYFNAFGKRAMIVKGGNATQRVLSAIKHKKQNESIKSYDHYWIVFDKDDAADEDFIQAIELAEKNNIRAAWSNQAFELWIILHYREFSHDCHRSKYDAHIREFIKWYDKNKKSESQGKQLYYHTYPLITSAIANARKIFETHSYAVLISINHSSTRVYELVELLEKERL